MGPLISSLATSDAVQTSGAPVGRGQRKQTKRAREGISRVQKVDVPSYDGSLSVDKLVEYINKGSPAVKQSATNTTNQGKKEVSKHQVSKKKLSPGSKKDPTESDSGCGDCILVDQGEVLNNSAEILVNFAPCDASNSTNGDNESEDTDSDVSSFFPCHNETNSLFLDHDSAFSNRYYISQPALNNKVINTVKLKSTKSAVPCIEPDSSDFIPVQRRKRTKRSTVSDINKKLSIAQKSRIARHENLCSSSSTGSTSSTQSSYASANSSVRSISPTDSVTDRGEDFLGTVMQSFEGPLTSHENLPVSSSSAGVITSSVRASLSNTTTADDLLRHILASNSELSFFAVDSTVDINTEVTVGISTPNNSETRLNGSCESKLKCETSARLNTDANDSSVTCTVIHRKCNGLPEGTQDSNMSGGCVLKPNSDSVNSKCSYSLLSSKNDSPCETDLIRLCSCAASKEEYSALTACTCPVVFSEEKFSVTSQEMNNLQFGFDCDIKELVSETILRQQILSSDIDNAARAEVQNAPAGCYDGNIKVNTSSGTLKKPSPFETNGILNCDDKAGVSNKNGQRDYVEELKSCCNKTKQNIRQKLGLNQFDLLSAQYFCYGVFCQTIQELERGSGEEFKENL